MPNNYSFTVQIERTNLHAHTENNIGMIQNDKDKIQVNLCTRVYS